MVRSTRRTWSLGLVPILAALCALSPAMAGSEASSPSSDRTKAAKAAGDLVPPLVVAKTQKTPLYPAAARASRISGSVVVEMTVNVEGAVLDAHAIDCSHPQVGFEQAAVDAVNLWKFRPALYRGEPVEYTTRFRLYFGRNAGRVTGATMTQASMRKGPDAATTGRSVERPRAGASMGSKKGTIPSRRR